jgi:murein DD-endopeptidase MepM/ murein hydrolase activator NlpD
VRYCVLILLSIASCFSITIRTADTSANVDESNCAARKSSNVFQSAERQVFLSFIARDAAAGTRLRIDWIDPSGALADSAVYPDLPAAQSLCFITQLPLAGFPAAGKPGKWSVRILVNDRESLTRSFEITGPPASDRVRITNVTRSPAGVSQMDLILDGTGFEVLSIVHIAQYTRDGGWRYIHSLLPSTAASNRLTVRLPSLGPGEYLALVKNPDDSLSQPSRFLVSTGAGYQLPIVLGERWRITQGPYGNFSHFGNTLHAFDIAPVSAKWVAAMRAGVVFTHDVGAVQSHTQRTFGNYITIQHDDGEFSHYGHLASGTFLVHNGERVEAGQPLARVGNSGYTLGEGGGYHVHVQISKSLYVYSQSIPFNFLEFPGIAATALRGRDVTGAASTASAVLRSTYKTPPAATRVALPSNARVFSGSVAVAGTWTDILTVDPQSKSLDVALSSVGEDRDLDLHLVSPSGHHYGWYADTNGYSGQHTNPQRWKIKDPEAGQWRLMVAGMKGRGELMDFRVEASTEGPHPATGRQSAKRR